MKPIPFQHPKIGTFFQPMPKLGNPYLGDGFLQRVLKRLLPQQVFQDANARLIQLGTRIEQEIDELGMECERNEPYLRQFDPWGKRVDELVTCSAWKKMKDITAEEGIIASGYDREFGEFSRIFQFAKCFIFAPSSGLYSCPNAMTDGAAKTIEALKLSNFDSVFKRLTSKDPSRFWTSGQWMTERKGGSDVANGTETIAVKQDDGTYRLNGYKWFSSATDADVALTLARIADSNGKVTEGTKGLSMFLLKSRREDGTLNNIQMMKLKDKLGTRSLPTAELLLDGSVAELVSEPGRGVASIANMLTITRLHNATTSVSYMRRMVLLARDYSQKRSCFGLEISKYPLHVDTLASLELEARAGTVLVFEILRLLGASETSSKVDSEEELLLRLLTPITKLYTAKKSMGVMSEGLECFGGQGYIEETGLPFLLRNCQVTPIWEGTTNVLSLDTLRAIGKSKGEALQAFYKNISIRLEAGKMKRSDLVPAADIIQSELDSFIGAMPRLKPEEAIARARLISFAIAEIEIGMLLVEHAASDVASKTDIATALRWARQMPKFTEQLARCDPLSSTNSYDMVFDGYDFYSKAKL